MNTTITPINHRPVVIQSQSDMRDATGVLTNLIRMEQLLTTEKEKLTKPLNAALKEIRDRYRPAEMKLGEAIAQVRIEMARYQTQALKDAKKNEEEIAKKVINGEMNLDDASVAIVDTIPTKSIASSEGTGTVSFRKNDVVRITNEKKVPRQYFDINLTRIKEALKKGKKVSGAVLDVVQTVVSKV